MLSALYAITHPEILTGSPDRAVKQGRGVKNKPSEILGSKRIVVTSLFDILGSRNVVGHTIVRLGIGQFKVIHFGTNLFLTYDFLYALSIVTFALGRTV